MKQTVQRSITISTVTIEKINLEEMTKEVFEQETYGKMTLDKINKSLEKLSTQTMLQRAIDIKSKTVMLEMDLMDFIKHAKQRELTERESKLLKGNT